MKALIQRITHFFFPTRSIPWFFLFVSLMTFGMMIPWFGYYWDDWAFLWISHQYGSAGLAQYFSTNRPVWGIFYQISTSVLGDAAWQWQIFSLLFRWVSASVLWVLLRLIWPRKQQIALWAALIFLVYPGFRQQAIAITYGHFYFIYSTYVLSLLFTVLAFRQPRQRLLYTAAALLLSAVNLFSMEYFFTLEALRPLLLWLLLLQQEEKKAFWKALRSWLPYAAVFLGAVIWRLFLFPYQTQNYQPLFLTTLKSDPLLAGWQLISQIAHDAYWTTILGMARAFRLPNLIEFGKLSTLVYAVLVITAALLTGIFLNRLRSAAPEEKLRHSAVSALLLGLAGILAAGWPFWLTSLPIGLEYPNSRFTIPFIFGISLFWAGLLALAPLPRWLMNSVLAVWLAFAVGQQFVSANDFRRDWETQQELFWQLSWRAPQLQPGTTVLSNELPIQYASDNSLTAPLNWLYSQDVLPGEMDYLFAYPSIRVGQSISELQADQLVHENYLAAEFNSSTDQMISIYFNPPGCVRVLDPEVDIDNSLLPPDIRQTVSLSNLNQIVGQPAEPAQLPRTIFRQEPAHRWCYYFEKAELARQQQDWQEVVSLGNTAFNLGDYPNDPAERFVFIEGYAHTADWQRALMLTQESAAITDLGHEMLCRLWDRIERETPESAQKTDTIQTVRSTLSCISNP